VGVDCEDGFKGTWSAQMQRNYRLLNVRNGLSRTRAMNLMQTLGETGFVSGNVKRALDVDKY